jgi:hypothetical protein
MHTDVHKKDTYKTVRGSTNSDGSEGESTPVPIHSGWQEWVVVQPHKATQPSKKNESTASMGNSGKFLSLLWDNRSQTQENTDSCITPFIDG